MAGPDGTAANAVSLRAGPAQTLARDACLRESARVSLTTC